MKSLRLLVFAFMFTIGILALSGSAQASTTAEKGTNPTGGGACTPGSVAPSPNVPGRSEFFGIDALTDNDVWAVGSYFTPTTASTITLIEHFDGTVWTQVASPNTASNFNQLNAVSAVSANDVWAVGNSGYSSSYGLIAMHWDGTAWSLVPTPSPTMGIFHEGLSSVFVLSPTDAWAVGFYAHMGTNIVLVLHWDGAQWLQVPVPVAPTSSVLNSVTAVSASDVWAVGSTSDGFSPTPLILHWDGSVWSQVAVSQEYGLLTSVDALTASDIWAVGYITEEQTLTMHWDGITWTTITSPNPGNLSNFLFGVSAIASDNVWAVGSLRPANSIDTTQYHPLVEHWDGAKWSVVSDPAAPIGSFAAVDAFAADDVLAAGGQDRPATLVEKWNGDQFEVQSTLNPGKASNRLAAVDALSPTDVWAVGSYQVYPSAPVLTQNTLIQHWDGYNWNIVPSPNGTSPENLLNAVDAVSANNVWAVGMTGSGGDYLTLTMHWDGTAWSVVPSPNPPSEQPKYLQSVSAIDSNDVWAVGFLSDAGSFKPAQTFIIHWDGSAWSIVSSPNVGPNSNNLYGVSAVSSNDVWAVGYYHDTSTSLRPLTLHWNGAQWAQVDAPSGTDTILFSISAVSANDVWAVGADVTASVSRTLAMHWDGSAWSIVPSPSFGAANNYLVGVSALSSDNIWAAGWFQGGTLIEHWDGAQWSISYITTPGQLENVLGGVSALSSNDVWAVGSASEGEPARTLIEHIGRFSDVNPGDYYFTPVSYLVAQGAISGYDDCTFRPGNDTTRGQLSKIVTLAKGWTLLDPSLPTFTDVSRGSTFYQYIETMYARGLISGYPCGGPGEPCDSESRPYFRPNAQVTRGQITKIVVLAAGWILQDPASATFTDVAVGSTFYTYVETASAHGVINGYGCGGHGEPCDSQNSPYFRPGFSATRGQIAKIVYNAVTHP